MQHTAEHAFTGHDTLAHFLIDRAAGVALLADLRELKNHITALEFRSDGERAKIKPGDDEIFSERAEFHLRAPRAERLDLLKAQQRNLPMPFPRVGIILDAPVLNESGGADVDLLRALFFADAHSEHLSHSNHPPI